MGYWTNAFYTKKEGRLFPYLTGKHPPPTPLLSKSVTRNQGTIKFGLRVGVQQFFLKLILS